MTASTLPLERLGAHWGLSPLAGYTMIAPDRSIESRLRCRLRRIEGQTRGLCRMWDEGRPIEDVLDQIAAARAALGGAALAMVREEAARRLQAPPPIEGRTNDADDLLALIDRVMR